MGTCAALLLFLKQEEIDELCTALCGSQSAGQPSRPLQSAQPRACSISRRSPSHAQPVQMQTTCMSV